MGWSVICASWPWLAFVVGCIMHSLCTCLTCLQGLFWVSDYDLSCAKGQHRLVMLVLAVPGLLFFSVGLPLGSWLFLRHNKCKLGNTIFSGAFGFLYEDYTGVNFYWESVVLGRCARAAYALSLAHGTGQA